MTIMEAILMLDNLVDESDPDVSHFENKGVVLYSITITSILLCPYDDSNYYLNEILHWDHG